MSGETKRADILYNIDDRPPVGKSVIFAFQHILAMFAGNVTVPLLVINIVGLNSEEGTFLIQCALLVAGVATLLQVRGIKAVGSRLPIVMGTSNAFLSTVVPSPPSTVSGPVWGQALSAVFLRRCWAILSAV